MLTGQTGAWRELLGRTEGHPQTEASPAPLSRGLRGRPGDDEQDQPREREGGCRVGRAASSGTGALQSAPRLVGAARCGVSREGRSRWSWAGGVPWGC